MNSFLKFFLLFLVGLAGLGSGLKASNFSDSKTEIMAILEDPQLEKTLGSDQQIMGIWKYSDDYWVWGSIFRYKVSISYSPEGDIQISYAPGIKVSMPR